MVDSWLCTSRGKGWGAQLLDRAARAEGVIAELLHTTVTRPEMASLPTTPQCRVRAPLLLRTTLHSRLLR